jgi:peptide-methionine (S)-S-oxide reductase
VALPAPRSAHSLTKDHDTRLVVFAGGCFWGVQPFSQHVRKVKGVPGYSEGAASTADYEVVSSGTTGNAESVKSDE